ncbi:CDP-diacylglycerol--serine O-phosphatidyltransferase [Cupriavidus taiwanensis]|uniref:CDP-diacylglycerol--serine O-phosphatidyltransferase n=1 Tax=Cupriavidus taiwanensis TaxID=164546 RepID=UPI000E13B7F0|nr:CDP-diacylglycerol--serine O-phosphatidyltransferase [Cupriavidus taiwanensis]SOY57563.1 CDP-diacylglycerol--serine O-phosphatidyltransferase [Cupriavidus taiwanensis]SPC05966.1 CDP-diacylglycerol--serine O-phosphatidyltransferase [Cupriavidus taiwanensis]
MVAFHRRNKRNTSGNVTHLRPFRHNQLRGADDGFDDEATDDHDIVYQRPRRRGIYLLPNAFTTAALFAGFFAIVQAMNMRFDAAAIAIFAAMVLDGMDGRVARITNTQSAFGEQYDSLSDMTSFGVAPALVMYEWILHDLGKWGWIAAFVYCTCAALRLARFNANIGVIDKRFFQGLPSPAAAALVAGFVWLVIDNKLPVKELWMPWVAFGITLYAGLSMVSNAPFYSGKALDVRYRVPFGMMVLVLVLFVVVSTDPPVALFGLFVAYAISGYVLWAWRAMHGKPAIEKKPRE